VIGTLAMKARAAGFDVAIVTGDKDFFQLVDDGIRVFNPRDPGTWYDPAGVVDKFGVRPDQVVDVLALMGDNTDNIKGVPGIGEKGPATDWPACSTRCRRGEVSSRATPGARRPR
jgi:DNA polymerase-1